MRSYSQLASEFDLGVTPYCLGNLEHLRMYSIGDVYDANGDFLLSSDIWEAWRYTRDPRPTGSCDYVLHFGNLQLLKPFAKRYSHEVLLGSGKPLSHAGAIFPYALKCAEEFLFNRGYTSLYPLTDPCVFHALWDAQISPEAQIDGQGPYPEAAVCKQKTTRAYWQWMQANYGVPRYVPPMAPFYRRRPVEIALDESKVIPDPVIRQLANKLSAHRNGSAKLNPYNHLRLCVLMLMIATGRRIYEILGARRGTKRNPPLKRYPTSEGSSKDALWFRFLPNKDGPAERVYISPEWEEITIYCVDELCRYSDSIRASAVPEERDLLILVSRTNWTAGNYLRTAIVPDDDLDLNLTGSRGEALPEHRRDLNKRVTGLSYKAFSIWLKGYPQKGSDSSNHNRGVLHTWNITVDGSREGEIYKLCANYARHTRQTALANDPGISIITRQRDLNHNDQNTQLYYQHQGKNQNQALIERMRKGNLFGKAAEAFRGMPELEKLRTGSVGSEPDSQYVAGRPKIIDERWRVLLAENRPLFEQAHRVPGGICSRPDGGPRGCKEYMNCTNASEGGCDHFCTDPNDLEMLSELNDNTNDLRSRQQESAAAGRTVKAAKEEVLASRAEEFFKGAIKRTTAEVLKDFKERHRSYEEKGL